MENNEEQKLEIKPIIEQQPFKNPAVQSFFREWCKVNSSIITQIVSRADWEKRGIEGILEEGPDGIRTLYLPEDLQLWEMVGVMEVVDRDTFSAKPEQQNKKKKELRHLGKLFQNAGVYIAQRLERITDGREIAQALAEEFYEYGRSLESGKRPDVPATLEDIKSKDLNPEELEEVDRFLAGESLYESRQARVRQAGVVTNRDELELYEKIRSETLAQFFRVLRKAFELKQKTEQEEFETVVSGLKPWQNDAPIHNAFLAKIKRALVKKIETPRSEFEIAILLHGMEKLVNEMRETIDMHNERTGQTTPGWKRVLNKFLTEVGLNPIVEQRKIADTLHLSQLRAELEEVRKSGDVEQISTKEREIADKIQQAISSFPYESDAYNPTKILVNQSINCVGASILGSVLMREVGLNHLVACVPEHSILFLITTDGQVEWRDMQNTLFNERLTNEMINGQRKDGQPLTVADIVAFSHKKTSEGLRFTFVGEQYRKKLPWVKEDQDQYVIVFRPEYGLKIQILQNMGNAFYSLGRYKEAIEAYQQAIAIYPKHPYPYNGLGNVFHSLGRYEEAIEDYQHAIAIDPKYAYPYNGLGNVFRSLGRYGEAIAAYQKFIELADQKKDSYWIERAKKIISKLKK